MRVLFYGSVFIPFASKSTNLYLRYFSQKPASGSLILNYRECLIGSVQYAEEPEVKCPYRDDKYSCNSLVQEREIKAVRNIVLHMYEYNGLTHCCVVRLATYVARPSRNF